MNMSRYRKVSPEIKSELEKIVGKKFVLSSKEVLEKHSIDESLEPPHLPEVVVMPGSTEAVSKIMKLAYEQLIPVTPQGSRTGLSAGAHPVYGGIALSLERMNRILEIDEENLMAIVEPGVLIMDLHSETEKMGLLYPPDPGEDSGSLGGNISTNAGGVRGMKYGVTRDFVKGLEVVKPNGDIIFLGGKIVKNSTGYSLKDLITGSEGTLGIVTKAILRLVPKPRYTALIFIPFDSTRDAAETVSEIVRRKLVPYALEFIQKHAVHTAERYLERKLPDNTHPAYLLIGVEGNSQEEVDLKLETVGEVCIETGAVEAYVADTKARQEKLWEARKCLFDAYKAFWEVDEVDSCVPRNRIPEYIEEAEKISQKYNVLISNLGHAGDGNVHSIIAKGDLADEEWRRVLNQVIDELINVSLKIGGTISGEHGIGFTKKAYLEKQVGGIQVELMKLIKKAFDPNNILNPGKVVDLDLN
jgi:glycolate oxidase